MQRFFDLAWVAICAVALAALYLVCDARLGAAATVPSAPEIGIARVGNGQAMLMFSPGFDGESAITNYTVTSSPGGITASGPASPVTINGLTNATAYTFTVTATNAIGTGVASSSSNSVTPAANLPTAPTIGTATAGDRQATVAFTAPADDGGSDILNYSAWLGASSTGWPPGQGAASPITASWLMNGVPVAFTVTATNANGTSIPSAMSNVVTPVPTVPSAPGVGTVTAGNGQATIAFVKPSSDGGSPITSYTATSTVGGITASGSYSPITVAGLTNGTPYAFTVKATNAIGAGAASSVSDGVIPVDDPVGIQVDYTLGQIAGAAETVTVIADRSWATFDPDGSGPLPSGPHLNAVALYVAHRVVGAVVDDPARRTIQAAVRPYTARPAVYVRTLFLHRPWLPSTAYALGDKVSGFTRHADLDGNIVPAYPLTSGYWTCTRAGTSGQVEPIWTPKVELATGWDSTYAAIARPTWAINNEWWYSGIFYTVLKKPWLSTLAPVSISPGGALQILRRGAPDYYVEIAGDDTHGPQYASTIYDPTKSQYQTVAAKVIQDPDANGVEWTYTADLGNWAFESNISGAATAKEITSRRYVEHGDTYQRRAE